MVACFGERGGEICVCILHGSVSCQASHLLGHSAYPEKTHPWQPEHTISQHTTSRRKEVSSQQYRGHLPVPASQSAGGKKSPRILQHPICCRSSNGKCVEESTCAAAAWRSSRHLRPARPQRTLEPSWRMLWTPFRGLLPPAGSAAAPPPSRPVRPPHCLRKPERKLSRRLKQHAEGRFVRAMLLHIMYWPLGLHQDALCKKHLPRLLSSAALVGEPAADSMSRARRKSSLAACHLQQACNCRKLRIDPLLMEIAGGIASAQSPHSRMIPLNIQPLAFQVHRPCPDVSE